MAFNYVGENSLATLVGDIKTKFDSKADITNVSNPNLLINPDFKINQRGQTRYTPTTSNIYSVDRWRVSVGYWCTYDNDVKALVVVCGTPKVNSWALAQRIENYENLKGKTVTFSVHCSAGADCYILLINDGKTQSIKTIPFKPNQTVSLTHTVSADATQLHVAICTNGQEETNALISLKWAKLEIGSVATPFVPPNPTTELIKCKRYFEKFNLIKDFGYATQTFYNSSFYQCTCNMIPKRIVNNTYPHISSDDLTGLYVYGVSSGTASTINVPSATIPNCADSNIIRLYFAVNSSVGEYLLRFDSSADKSIYIDAEM